MTTTVETTTAVTAPVDHAAPGRELRPVRDHLVVAVVCALVCFAPLGVAAVVCAGNVRTRLAMGDVEGARRASRMATRLCWASSMTTMGFLLMVVIGVATSPGP